jgi:uncharacterized membrane protein YbhN (UPF0104 family)
LVLVSVLVWRLDWRQVATAFAELNLSLWLIALAIYLVAQLASSVRWRLLAQVHELEGSHGRFLAYYFIGMFFNLVLPTSVGGDVVRAWYLARQAEGRRTGAFLSVLADRGIGLVVLIAVACVALWLYPQPLPLWVTATVLGLGAASAAAVILFPALPWLKDRLPLHPRMREVLSATTIYLRYPGALTWATLLSLVVQLANIVLAWLIGRGLGLNVPLVYYCILSSVVSVLTLLPVSVNGMGLREWGTALLLAPLSVSPAQAVTLSLLIFAVQAAASLGGCGFYLLGQFPRFQAAPAAPAVVEVRPHVYTVSSHSDQGRARQPSTAA